MGMKLMPSVASVVVAKEEVTTSESRLLTRFWWRWMVSTTIPVSSPLPQLTELIFLIKRCCDLDDSIVRLLSISPTSRDAKESSVCTHVASLWNPMSISKRLQQLGLIDARNAKPRHATHPQDDSRCLCDNNTFDTY